MAEPMLPVRYRVTTRVTETADSATLTLEPVDQPLPGWRPGQFMMLYVYGVGEVPISVSGGSSGSGLVHTVRAVGAVSRALYAAEPGTVIGVRGPFGTTWAVDRAEGGDVVIVAGGIGLAPLRPVVLSVLARRAAYDRAVLVVGARTPSELLYRDELAGWTRRDDLDVRLTVDRPEAGWQGAVGFVTEPLSRLELAANRTTAFLCGPEPMMRFSAEILRRKQLPARRIRLSLERSMKCGVGLCGHCQLGPLLVCRDGPVVDHAVAAPLTTVAEL